VICSSGGIAKERAALMIASDRLSSNEEEFVRMREELLQLLSRYMDLDFEQLQVQIKIVLKTRQGVQDVKTIQIK
jgi:septum formation topological specificity factor MinE